ncbi:MAG TPA: hypothetical protein VEW46_13145 [Pyrinomonadaceae bacterium]|nr:hypothetical protein [Pyrinomonadaceae bacterium]
MAADEAKLKHLELIQSVISRLAGNSFSMKGWSIPLVAALMALAAKDANERYAAVALLPALCFWGLDAYYLRQERLYRKLYNAVNLNSTFGNPPAPIPSLSMNTLPVEPLVKSCVRIIFSKSVFWLHAPILVAVVAVTTYASTH